MALNLRTFPRFLSLLLRLKLLNLTSRFPPLPGGVLDEQTSILFQAASLVGGTPLDQMTPAGARQDGRNGIKMLKSLGALYETVHEIRHLSIPSEAGPIPAWLYLPGPEKNYPLFVYYHGGGFVVGDLVTTDSVCRFLCQRTGCAVLSVDYRLAPEYPFPAAVEDCLTATRWAAEHGPDLSADPSRLLVGGDSAGGTLAAVISQLCRLPEGPRILAQVLFYPSGRSDTFDTPSFQAFGEQPLGLTRRDVEWYLDQYAPDPQDRLDPRVSPLLAPSLFGLPPALVVTCEFDVLRDEGEDYARRLQESGVPATLLRCNGMAHGFLNMVGFLRRSTLYFDQIAAEIRHMIEEIPEREASLSSVAGD